MGKLTVELRAIYDELIAKSQVLQNSELLKPLEALETCANTVGKAWGHSWIGYQSRVYYEGLKPPPPGEHFSSEWGFEFSGDTFGGWREFPQDFIETEIRQRAGNPDLSKIRETSDQARVLFERKRDDIVSILRTFIGKREDQFVQRLLEEAEKTKACTQADFIACFRPSEISSRDSLAIAQGAWTPPHFIVLVETLSIRAPMLACESLAKIARKAFSHFERQEENQCSSDRIGTNVFIGHGGSKEWKDLKDFIQDRMRLPWDEFNRVPVAGIPNAVRLSTMLDAAQIAFLVLTAEDERSDGSLQARMNVIHEAGLFQGRLGFTRAIVMLEEGCQEFSNIEGLGQLRFPKNNIKAAFHDVQLILEREGLIEPPEL